MPRTGFIRRASARLDLKDIALHISKRAGLFVLARRLTGRGLRILCYHAFELGDERRFRPRLFIAFADFTKRMELLARGRYPVLPLGEALDRMAQHTLPPSAVVITIDDGFHGVRWRAAEILKRYGFPATTYLTTYYVEKDAPIFRLVVRYMFFHTTVQRIERDPRPWLPDGVMDLRTADARAGWEEAVIAFGEQRCTEDGRQQICRELGDLLKVDYGRIRQARILSLMDQEELLELKAYGVDVQLHTHRHRFPVDDKVAAESELADNRRALQRLLGEQTFQHFCYPSGCYEPTQWPWLAEAGVRSATTCEPGLNYTDTPRFQLRRFLDSSEVSAITFEAELSGYLELARRCRTFVRGLSRRFKATESRGDRQADSRQAPVH